ncbi:MAG: response regulator [Desulfobacterium sp.]|nr:response regulator [Desulfobacterium sp.]
MSRQIKVLMVDDEERFRKTTSTLLTKRGFATTIAASGEQAIAIIKEKPQDVVILDIMMDGMDGHRALAEIKRIAPDTEVIMLTGHGTPDSAIKALVRSAFDYLNKPCDIDLLAMKIKDAYTAKTIGAKHQDKKARDIMLSIEDYTTVTTDATLKEAMEKLLDSFKGSIASSRLMETGHRSLLIFDNTNTPVGILSIMDLLEAVRPAYLSAPKPSMADSVQYSSMFWDGMFFTQTKALADKKVAALMGATPPVIHENTNLMEVADLMVTSGLRRLIVTKDERVIGIIREQDLFFEMAKIIL